MRPAADLPDMLARMSPHLDGERYVFCTTAAPAEVGAAAPLALGTLCEVEGWSLILREADALRFGFGADMPMRRITLRVHSALDGVGLTAAVASALAADAIPCNVVAAYHHDHVFVPAERAADALRCLLDLTEGGEPAAADG